MTALLTSLPGDIPDLLKRGSPILGPIHAGREWAPGVVLEIVDDFVRWALVYVLDGCETVVGWPLPRERALLDLTDPTARAQAAAWATRALHYQTDPMGYWLPSATAPDSSGAERVAIAMAERWQDMTPTQFDTLARLVLRLAGRAP